MLQQQHRCAGAQVGTGKPFAPFPGGHFQPVFDRGLLDRQLLFEHVEHGLIAVAIGIETIPQAQCLSRVFQHAGVSQSTSIEHFQQPVGDNAVQAFEAAIIRATAQQFQGFHRAVVRDEVVVAVVTPVHLGRVLDQVVDLRPRQIHGHRGQAAQFGLGVFVDHLPQRQDEQARRVHAGQAVPTGKLYVADEGAVRQHQVLIQVQTAIRSTRASGLADHQPQHAVTPAADPVLVGFGQQVIDGVHALGVDCAQWLTAKVAAGVKEREGCPALTLGCGGPVEMFFVVRVQRGTTAGVVRVEEEILHVDRDELTRVADLVDVRATGDLAVVFFTLAPAADVLLPASEVKQPGIVAESEATGRFATATVRQTDLAQAIGLTLAIEDQRTLGTRP